MPPSGYSSSYFLSASQGTSSRSRLFRPKELREFVFPGVGMIMHSLFWVKHSAHLHQRDIDVSTQEQLLLYATTDEDVPLYDEGLLWYILASRLDEESSMRLTAGVKTVKDYLFEPQYDYEGDIYDRVAEEIQRMASQGESYDADRFVDDVLAPWFVTRCRDRGIDLPDRIQNEVVPEALDDDDGQMRSMRALSGFCELVGGLVREHSELRGTSDLNVIGSTTQFALQLLVPENGPQIDVLADTSFRFTPAQATALLQAVAELEHGQHFVRSILFVTHIGPLKHSGSEFDREMRRIHDIVTSDSEAILESGSAIVDLKDLPTEATTHLDETSYYWLLNFFMADGETISRTLLDTEDPILSREVVEAHFDQQADRTGTFEDFLTRTEAGLEYLPRLLSEIDPDDSHRIHRFLNQLETNLEQRTDPPQVLLDLLEVNGTIEPETEARETYRIREFPTNTNSASFYGIGPLRGWTETLLQANE
jgi:hypothetical protein